MPCWSGTSLQRPGTILIKERGGFNQDHMHRMAGDTVKVRIRKAFPLPSHQNTSSILLTCWCGVGQCSETGKQMGNPHHMGHSSYNPETKWILAEVLGASLFKIWSWEEQYSHSLALSICGDSVGAEEMARQLWTLAALSRGSWFSPQSPHVSSQPTTCNLSSWGSDAPTPLWAPGPHVVQMHASTHTCTWNKT